MTKELDKKQQQDAVLAASRLHYQEANKEKREQRAQEVEPQTSVVRRFSDKAVNTARRKMLHWV